MKIIELETERLLLRQWSKDDYPAFATMNADPVVMEYYPDTLTSEQSDALAEKFENMIAQQGWGFWALELKDYASMVPKAYINRYMDQYSLKRDV